MREPIAVAVIFLLFGGDAGGDAHGLPVQLSVFRVNAAQHRGDRFVEDSRAAGDLFVELNHAGMPLKIFA